MTTLKLRPAVRKFAEDMERVLRQTDNRPGWKDCPKDWLFTRLMIEALELKDALPSDERLGFIKKECLDVANFAMMIYDNVDGDAGLQLILSMKRTKED